MLLTANAVAENNVDLSRALLERVAELVLDNRKEEVLFYAAPWNGVVSLSLEFEEASETKVYTASGVLIDDGFVLTSAHNIYTLHNDSFSRKITIFPGRNGDLAACNPGIILEHDKIWIHPHYRLFSQDRNEVLRQNNQLLRSINLDLQKIEEDPTLDPNRIEVKRLVVEMKYIIEYNQELLDFDQDHLRVKYDVALIDCRHIFKQLIEQHQLFTFTLEYCPVTQLQSQPLILTGFPGWVICNMIKTVPDLGLQYYDEKKELKNLRSRKMMSGTGRLVPRSRETSILKHLMVATKGNSGSPIYFQRDNEMICCGIHSDGAPEGYSFNRGTHLTKSIIEDIREWIEYRKDFDKAREEKN